MTLGHPPTASSSWPLKWPLVLRNERSLVRVFEILRGWESDRGRDHSRSFFAVHWHLSVIHPQLKCHYTMLKCGNYSISWGKIWVFWSRIAESYCYTKRQTLTSSLSYAKRSEEYHSVGMNSSNFLPVNCIAWNVAIFRVADALRQRREKQLGAVHCHWISEANWKTSLPPYRPWN